MNILWLELVYTLLIVGMCVLIFRKTRKLYLLSDHKGIYYVSYAFLFFAIGYLSRYLALSTGLLPEIAWFFILGATSLFFLATLRKSSCELCASYRQLIVTASFLYSASLLATIWLFQTTAIAYFGVILQSSLASMRCALNFCHPRVKINLVLVATILLTCGFIANGLLDHVFSANWYRYVTYALTLSIFCLFYILVWRVTHGKKA